MARKTEATDKTDKVIIQRIQQLRINKGMSQEQLGKFVGVSYQQIAKYLNGSNRISAARLKAIATALGKRPQYFYDNEEDFIPEPTEHERLRMDMSRAFMKIKNVKQQVALVAIARSMEAV